MDNGFERTYWANDVAELLDISVSALRKWSLRLEAEGYCILRDEHDRRAYRECDLIALRTMQDFLRNKMSMENASKASDQQRTDEVQTSVLHTNRSSNERLLEIENRNVMPSIHKSFKIDIARGISSLDL
ncbi:MerR family transcriptional regulator [Brevibacillus laterosporus]|uniref:MerR family transcriptional regulator n=1 Tax=Brevibacillus laterosporus TaxID=1465 RepID=UPI002E1D5E32|nr:MerR family transcriptional regulator [Brevibacillus laterosporus]MED1787214.1 MerR family transcriptional regulator [Brevibacillus laterosporus]